MGMCNSYVRRVVGLRDYGRELRGTLLTRAGCDDEVYFRKSQLTPSPTVQLKELSGEES